MSPRDEWWRSLAVPATFKRANLAIRPSMSRIHIDPHKLEETLNTPNKPNMHRNDAPANDASA